MDGNQHHTDSARNGDTPPSPSQILLAQDLHKSYGGAVALHNLTFSLNAGRVLGFLGPNGAGKTTAIRILTTILEPSSGRFVVDGVSSDNPSEIRRRIGVLPESLGLPKQLTGWEFLSYFGQHYGYSAAAAKKTAHHLLEEVGLHTRGETLINTYSRGMRQRLGIARSLINDPAVVFLDEPTLGLDPRGHQELLALVRQIARERKAGVVLCSHLLSEIEGVCDDVVIMRAGEVVAAGTVADVVGRGQNNVIRVHIPPAFVDKAMDVIASVPGVLMVTVQNGGGEWLDIELGESEENTPSTTDRVQSRILNILLSNDIPILTFEAEGGRLQEVFLQLTEGSSQ